MRADVADPDAVRQTQTVWECFWRWGSEVICQRRWRWRKGATRSIFAHSCRKSSNWSWLQVLCSVIWLKFSYNKMELELPLLLLSHCPWPQKASPAARDIWPPAERAVVSGGRWWELRGSELPEGIWAHVLFHMQGAELAELSDSQPCGRAGQDDSWERFPSFMAVWP